MNILIVEDGLYKSERVQEFITSTYEHVDMNIASSYSSGVREIVERSYDLVILDMSLPTFDELKGQGGGERRMYGGLDIARQIKRRNVDCSFLFLTQHQSFTENPKLSKLSDIDDKARFEYGEKYLGCVYYEHAGFKWKDQLKELMDDIT